MINLTFIDFDHENERHVEVSLLPGLRISIDRTIETNPDYLSSGADAPEDWEDSRELEFATGADARSFVNALADELLDNCFAFFHDDEEVDDSDVARGIISGLVENYGVDEEGRAGGFSGDQMDAIVAELTQYPR